MTINIHPSAADNFNKKADELYDLVKELPQNVAQQESFPSDLHIAGSIIDEDIVGDIKVATSDYQGNTIGRLFNFNGKIYGLDCEDYKRVKSLAERIQSSPGVRTKLSCSFVEEKLFDWISNKYKGLEISQPYMKYLDDEAQAVVKTITSWIPIANLEVQSLFPISNSQVLPLSKEVMDRWESKVGSMAGEHKEKVVEHFKQTRKTYQGLASVVTVIEAEPEYAFDYTLEEAQKITSILGIFSGATLIPDIKCVSNIKGSENIAQAAVFFESDKGELGSTTTSILDKASAKYWRLSEKDIVEIRKGGLDKISSLLAADSLNDFEKHVLNSVFLYSKSAFTADPVEKVVYMLSSLESILLKNENEPIQQNLAERLSVFTAQKLEERKSIIKTIKSVYGVRSRYLHHGHTSSELELISDFMKRVWVFFVQLLANVNRFSSQEEFVSAIDDHKLG